MGLLPPFKFFEYPISSSHILNIPNSKSFLCSRQNTHNSRILEFHGIPFLMTTAPYRLPQILPIHAGSYNHWSWNQVSFRAIKPSISHQRLYIMHFTWCSHTRKASLPAPCVKQYFLSSLKLTSPKTSRDACCSWTIPNLLQPDNLISVIFHHLLSKSKDTDG